jgi:hypothetical protein
MQVTSLLAPYLVALAAFPLLVHRDAGVGKATLVVACCLTLLSPWLIPTDELLQRFMASVSSAMVAVKVVDAWLDATHRCAPTWTEYVAFLANPFVHVRRCLPLERRPTPHQDAMALAVDSAKCAVGICLLVVAFGVDWKELPFLFEHGAKVSSLMLAIVYGLNASASLWRLGGGAARNFMAAPFSARTPADFWRRYNRNMQLFFWKDVFGPGGGRRAPVRTTLLVFSLSATLHELIFLCAVGRVQGYQAAFFAVQGLASALTARQHVRRWTSVPWLAGTLMFNLLSSVLFFASIHGVVPFYDRGLPNWLWHA